MTAQLPRISRASPKIGCASPAHLPSFSRASPAHLGAQLPHPLKGVSKASRPQATETRLSEASTGEVRQKVSHDKVEGRWSRPKTDVVRAAPDAWQKIEDLAQRVLRLTVSRRDPEQFFVERSDIADEMRRLARAVRQ